MASPTKPPSLSAIFKNSFAYKTVKDRLPVILTKAIDTTHRHNREMAVSHGEEGSNDVKAIIHKLAEMRYRLTTDKPLTPIESQRHDGSIWNAHLEKLEKSKNEQPSWFKSAWLDVECYFYRKIQEAFDASRFMQDWDPFRYQKEQSFVGALEPMSILSEHMKKLLEDCQKMGDDKKREHIEKLLQVSLWGNKFDLSISGGEQVHNKHNPLEQVDEYRDKILINDLSSVSTRLLNESKNGSVKRRVDIILDNAGMELFGDLCVGEFLLSAKICDQVVFHVKDYPWFVSDTTSSDFYWVLEMLLGNSTKSLRELGEKWQSRLDDSSFKVKSHPFWTLPYAFNHMPDKGTDLWQYFNDESLLAIFKGDMNFRKLVGDLAWPSTTPFSVAVQEFRPKTPFVVLRTLKADVVTGMKEGEAEKMSKKDSEWMVSGNYALIQYLDGSK